MTEATGPAWNLLCCWEGVLAYGPLTDRLTASLALRTGSAREDVQAALGKLDLRALAAGTTSLSDAAGALEHELERGIDAGRLEQALAGALYFRISGLALLESMRSRFRTAVVGDAPGGLHEVLRERLGAVVGQEAVVLSRDLGASVEEPATFPRLLEQLGMAPAETVLVGGSEAMRQAAAAAEVRCFEIPPRIRSAWTHLQQFLTGVAAAPPAPVVAPEAAPAVTDAGTDDLDPGVADPIGE